MRSVSVGVGAQGEYPSGGGGCPWVWVLLKWVPVRVDAQVECPWVWVAMGVDTQTLGCPQGWVFVDLGAYGG